ncbi:hypothetical protein HDU97_001931 [Phlyctochytrium planicorne]|nr:hypothetical protein HDU97_001931 [Phlyctochytrium planicorne]
MRTSTKTTSRRLRLLALLVGALACTCTSTLGAHASPSPSPSPASSNHRNHHSTTTSSPSSIATPAPATSSNNAPFSNASSVSVEDFFALPFHQHEQEHQERVNAFISGKSAPPAPSVEDDDADDQSPVPEGDPSVDSNTTTTTSPSPSPNTNTNRNNSSSSNSGNSRDRKRKGKNQILLVAGNNTNVLVNNGVCFYSTSAKGNIYCPNHVIDIVLRSMAIMLSFTNIVLFLATFGNWTSVASLMTIATFSLHGVAIFCSLLPYARITAPSIHLTVYANVGLLLFTSDLFLWLLYLRFTAILPIKSKTLKHIVLSWMCLESAATFAIWIVWVVGAEKRNGLREMAADIYGIGCVVQAGTALFLSGYFVIFFFFPRLKGLKSVTMFITFFTSGLAYLILETTLQLGFTIFLRVATTRDYYTGLNVFCTAIRHGIFILFILAIRDASATAERGREEKRREALAEKSAFYSKVAAAASPAYSKHAPSPMPPHSRRGGDRRSWSSALSDDDDQGYGASYSTQSTVPHTASSRGQMAYTLSTPRPSSYLTDGGHDFQPPPSAVVAPLSAHASPASSPGSYERNLMVHGAPASYQYHHQQQQQQQQGGQERIPAPAVYQYKRPEAGSGRSSPGVRSQSSPGVRSQSPASGYGGRSGRNSPAVQQQQQQQGGGRPKKDAFAGRMDVW